MARTIEIITQKMLVPHSNLNGNQTYKDYGFQKIWIYDADDSNKNPVLFAGWAPSGRMEIDANPTGAGIAGYSPLEDPCRISGELVPIIKHVSGVAQEEATGIMR